ncbi:MAG: RIP metalloprotease RseP [Deltaproteobacteria bacterium]|nr:RIP metalloprotease RseP [Deltaproteobacteria bacterium]
MMVILQQLWVIVALIGGFGLLVLIHEFGHFIVARRSGIRVEAFSIGFGRVLWQRRRGDTEYRVSLLPLGGYVKMTGEDPDDTASASDPRSYANQSVGTRMRVILAGPVMNLLLAALVMPIPFMLGRERPAFEANPPIVEEVRRFSSADVAGIRPGERIVAVNQRPVATWADVQDAIILAGKGGIVLQMERAGAQRDVPLGESRWGFGIHPSTFLLNRPVVDGTQPGSPAAAAGLQAGDRVTAVAGQPVQYWDELSLACGAGRNLWFWLWAARAWGGRTADALAYVGGQPLELTVVRGDVTLQLQVEPRIDPELGRAILGVTHDPDRVWAGVPKVVWRYGLGQSIVRGTQELGRLFRLTGDFLVRLIHAPSEHYSSLAGPVRIFSMFAQIAQEGLSPYLYFLAFFSLQLGMLNLLPIPVLDGGHLFFLAIEACARRPLARRAREVAQYVGLVFLLSVFVFVTVNDLGSFAWVRRLVDKIF